MLQLLLRQRKEVFYTCTSRIAAVIISYSEICTQKSHIGVIHVFCWCKISQIIIGMLFVFVITFFNAVCHGIWQGILILRFCTEAKFNTSKI